ncbi:hypothetical protein [Bifidobacterium gallicum]|nr:hypothetical protein [Bifidobacterium gallicum]EFA23291.1 hypothetical protein BIFGAL_03408 [Bifidobacterium gallicum DSM 20093 = LMG 11596]
MAQVAQQGVRVVSRVYGGMVSVDDEQRAQRVVALLDQARAALARSSTQCSQLAFTATGAQSRMAWCAANNTSALGAPTTVSSASGVGAASADTGLGGAFNGAVGALSALNASMAASAGSQHATLPADIAGQASAVSTNLASLAQECETLASLLSRAYSLYAQAESSARRLGTQAAQQITAATPWQIGASTLLSAGGGLLYGLVKEGHVNAFHALNGTTWMQEGTLNGLSGWVNMLAGATGMSAVGTNAGVDQRIGGAQARKSTAVANAAANLSQFLQPWHNYAQGTDLTVTQVGRHAQVVGATTSVSGALSNLRRLGENRSESGLTTSDDTALSYGTIAISQYVRDDGTNAWLVSIPGTDGKDDSPFGWPQNVELMSSNSEQRMNAESARMVVEAMRQAGIKSDEPVAMVGHSQGGIVAAAIASDCADEFTIDHIVTAGSPIANHPIASSTWVTAIEMDDELVAALDGKANPSTDTWLTVRGSLDEGALDQANALNSGTGVERDPNRYEITHWLKYHESAYEDASALGSPAVQTHEQHFANTIDGTYQGTTYWQGRVTKDHADSVFTAIVPQPRAALAR